MPFDSRFRYYHAVLRAILFDFNGVLVDDEPIHLELLGKVLEQEGVDPSSRNLDRFLGISDRDALTTVLEEVGEEAAPDRISRLIARKAAYYQMRVHGEGFPVFPGALELIQSALEREWMLGVVSGALRSEVEGALEQMGLFERFKGVVTSDDVEQGKPAPEGYLKGLTLFNSLPPLPRRLLHPHEVLAVEDTPAGLTAAAAAGLSTLGVAHTCPAEDLAGADHVVSSLAQLQEDGGVDRLLELFAGS